MRIVRNLSSTQVLNQPEIKQLVQHRINDLGGEAFDSSVLGYFLIVEAGDTIKTIQAQVGFDILQNHFTGIPFNANGFTPSFEFIEEFPACYDMVFVLDDTGFGVEIFVPRDGAIDPDLITICQMYAYKAPPEDAP